MDRGDKTKVLYFTDKKQTSAIMKSFSKRYLDKLSLGEVRSSDELSQKFKIEKFPTLLVVTDISEYQGDIYEGEMKVDQIQKFLNSYAHSSQPKKVNKKMEFEKLTEKKEQSLCSSSKMCLIVFVQEDNQI